MKIADLLEADVINLADRRSSAQDASRKQYERVASEQYNDLIRWMNAFKSKYRVPGFSDLGDVSMYLAVDMRLPTYDIKQSQRSPSEQTRIKDWYAKLSDTDKGTFRMVANHAPRLIQAYDQIGQQVREFQDRWWKAYKEGKVDKKFRVLDEIIELDHEIARDKEQMQRVPAIAEIIEL